MTDTRHLWQALDVASKLVESRDQAVALFGNRYAERIKPYRDAIRLGVKKTRRSVARVLIDSVNELENVGKADSVSVLMLCAAACDELESEGES